MKSLQITILLVLSILLLSGCTIPRETQKIQYKYTFHMEMCNGKEKEISFIDNCDGYTFGIDNDSGGYRYIGKSVPEFYYCGRTTLNVCDFSYTRSEILTK